MITRLFKKPESHSFFLFGARGTGKSTWLKQQFADIPHHYINLLDPDTEERFARHPSDLTALAQGLEDSASWIVIDEIQKVPKLLDLVHHCIETFGINFALTGSSARKLKRGAANLLAGRAFVSRMFPFTHVELEHAFSLNDALHWGNLPHLSQLPDAPSKARYLRTYTQTYLKEEIVAEQVVRKLDPFRYFLEIAAQQNGDIINYANIARDVGVDPVTVQSYFQILEDTLVGYLLPPYHRSVRKRQRSNPKFYFFDLGVKRSLTNALTLTLQESTYAYGKAFEHLIITEIIHLNHYLEKDYRLSYLRTKDDAEIDLIIERPGLPTALIEIKSATHVDERDTRSLERFSKDFSDAEPYVLSNDPDTKRIGTVRAMPWRDGLRALGLTPTI